MTKSHFSITRRYSAKIIPATAIPKIPILIPGEGNKLLNATNSSPPSKPVKAAAPKVSVKENLLPCLTGACLGNGVGTGAGAGTGTGAGVWVMGG